MQELIVACDHFLQLLKEKSGKLYFQFLLSRVLLSHFLPLISPATNHSIGGTTKFHII